MKIKILLLIVSVVLVLNSSAHATVTMDFVPVGNAGNTADSLTGYGAVGYNYSIGKYEVTTGQYAEFLNAVAATDTYGLYDYIGMSSIGIPVGGCNIQRSGSSGSYTYSVAADWANRPVNYVSWHDALRFSNWLHNGQPTGPQNTSTTEDGAYDMSLGLNAVRKSGATVWLPNRDEWYKAAYHKNDGITGNYFLYPTSSDSPPGNDMTETTNPGNNVNLFAIWDPYFRTEVGEFELSDSPYGTFDMGGNIWECTDELLSGSALFMGGSYNISGTLRSIWISATYPTTYETNYLGFRVASVPEPCSLGLLSLGGLALLRKRRLK